MSLNNAISTTDLLVEYATAQGPIQALSCRGFVVPAGTSMAVTGSSGCGKSTLLSLLAGLLIPTSGSIELGGSTISALSERERVQYRRHMLGMVYQADNLLPFLTIEENVSLQLGICGRSGPDAGPEVSGLLAKLGLAGLEKRLPDQLSGGQRQRAAVARAVVHRPGVILADEPTGALDAKSANAVMDLLVAVHRELGSTLIVVSHDPAISARLDRTLLLEPPAAATRVAYAQ